MSKATFGILIVSLAGILAALAMTSTLQNFNELANGQDGLVEALTVGELLHPAMWKRTWRANLLDLRMEWLIHWPVLIAAGAWIVLAAWRVRFRLGKSWTAAGAACLLFIPPAYAVMRLALMHNQDPGVCGPWIVVGLMGALYALAACAAMCILDILGAVGGKRNIEQAAHAA